MVPSEKLRQDRLYTSANLIGFAVLCHLMAGWFLQPLAAFAGRQLQASAAAGWLPVLIGCLLQAAALLLPFFLLRSWTRGFGLPPLRLARPSKRVLLAGAPLFLCFTTLCSALSNLLRILLGWGGYTPPDPVQLPRTAAGLACTFLSVCLLPAFLEELLFRGMLQRILAPYGDWFSILVSSGIFALLHSDLSQLPAIFALSLFLGYVAAATGNLGNCILLHFANNLSGFLLLWGRQRMDGANAMGLSAVLFSLYFAGGLAALFILLRSGGARRLPRYPTRKNRMGRAERLLCAPFFSLMLLLLTLITVMEYFR